MPDQIEDDRFLVQRYARGRDEESFRLLYRRHESMLFRLCLSATGDDDLASDAVQETWLRAARGIEHFRGSSSFRTWLCGIAVNCCRELRRAGLRTAGIDETMPMSARRRDDAGRLDLIRAIADLPDRSREVLVLHEILGYTHPEIGEILGIEPGTSKSQLSYARRLLLEWFDKGERPIINGVDHD